MSLSDFINRNNKRIEDLKRKREERLLLVSLDAKALVQLRIQTSGENSEGSSFEDYTPDYKKYGRDQLGYQSEYVDYTRTGEMWRNITPKVISSNETVTVVEIAGRSQETINKLRGQVVKRGNPLSISDDEIKIVRDAYAERLLNDLGL